MSQMWFAIFRLLAAFIQARGLPVRLVETKEASVEVWSGGKPFTADQYGLAFHKPVLYPLMNAGLISLSTKT